MFLEFRSSVIIIGSSVLMCSLMLLNTNEALRPIVDIDSLNFHHFVISNVMAQISKVSKPWKGQGVHLFSS